MLLDSTAPVNPTAITKTQLMLVQEDFTSVPTVSIHTRYNKIIH